MFLPKVIKGVPSSVTLTSLCLGLWAIKFSISGDLNNSVICVLIAILLDGMDGKLARYLNSASNFGATLDTLADFANFGITPALIIYHNFLSSSTHIHWFGVLFFAICMSLRLARFNASPAQHSAFFIGVPAPAGAMLVLSPVFLHILGFTICTNTFLFFLVFTALLLISKLPTYAVNKMQISRHWITVFSVVLTMFISAVFFFPWEMILAINFLYLCTFPFSYRSYKKLLHSNKKKTTDLS